MKDNLTKNQIKKLKQNKHQQLTLFEYIDDVDSQYSNTIELYDAIPKYVLGKQKKTKESVPIIREFSHKNIKYKTIISPATIVKIRDDNIEDSFVRFPSKREELVEEALRKIACHGSSVLIPDNEKKKTNHVGVYFTLYELREELKKNGHSYSINQIIESIEICAGTNIKVMSADKKNIISSHMFVGYGLTTKEDWKESGKKSYAFVQFNPLVTNSINDKTFRQINYNIIMSLKNYLSRWLYKKLSHNYTQASMMTKDRYTILLSTIIRDSGVTKRNKPAQDIANVKKSLDELKKEKILMEYNIEKIMQTKKDGTLHATNIKDAKFTFIPTPKFISEIKKANKRQKNILKKNTSNLK